MRKDVRDRLLLPLLLPVGILLFIALILWGFSRILLGLTATTATITAVVAALGIMVIAAIAAGRTTVRGSTIGAMFAATAGVAMLAGGIALAVVAGGEEGDGEGPPDGEVHVVELVAQDIAFNPTNLTVPAGVPFQIAFDNRDAGQQHNVAIYDNPDFSGTPVFSGDLVTGPVQTTYDVDPLAPGPYAFVCIVHPTMTGQIEAVEGEGEPGGGPGGEEPGGGEEPPGAGEEPGDGLTVVAQNVAFDTQTIELPPEAVVTITLDNRDAGTPHNISIYSD
ncbi:MAG: cupredoxin domain-containing protein, partial [Actinomycetota bacterium]